MDPIESDDLKCIECVHYQKEHYCGRCIVTVPPWVGKSAEYEDDFIYVNENWAPECELYLNREDSVKCLLSEAV